MSAQPRLLAEVLAEISVEEAEWCGYLQPAEIEARLRRYFARPRPERTLHEVACQLEIPPSQLARHCTDTHWAAQFRWEP